MIDRLTTAAAAAMCLIALATASAQTATTAKPPTPVNIESDQMEIIDADKTAIFRGNVDATRGDTNLKSDELVVTYDDVKQPDGTTRTDATNLDAKGHVTITTPRETITGDWANFKPQTNKLVVGGNVRLVQGSTVITGTELHADTATNKIEMTGGRVKGSFLPQSGSK